MSIGTTDKNAFTVINLINCYQMTSFTIVLKEIYNCFTEEKKSYSVLVMMYLFLGRKEKKFFMCQSVRGGLKHSFKQRQIVVKIVSNQKHIVAFMQKQTVLKINLVVGEQKKGLVIQKSKHPLVWLSSWIAWKWRSSSCSKHAKINPVFFISLLNHCRLCKKKNIQPPYRHIFESVWWISLISSTNCLQDCKSGERNDVNANQQQKNMPKMGPVHSLLWNSQQANLFPVDMIGMRGISTMSRNQFCLLNKGLWSPWHSVFHSFARK